MSLMMSAASMITQSVLSGSYASFSREEKAHLVSGLQDCFAYNNWQQLTPEMKRDCCQALSAVYCDAFGIPEVPLVRDSLGDGVYGGYYKQTGIITLNNNLFENGTTKSQPLLGDLDNSNWQLYDTVVHETFHAYQKWALDNPEEFVRRAEDKTKAMDQLHEWALNEGHYWDDSRGRPYLYQPVERDAWEFAHDETLAGFNGIQERNGPEPAEQREKYNETWEVNNPEQALKNEMAQNPDCYNQMMDRLEQECEQKGIKYNFDDLAEQSAEDESLQNETADSEELHEDTGEFYMETEDDALSREDEISTENNPDEAEINDESADPYEEDGESQINEDNSSENVQNNPDLDQEETAGEDHGSDEIETDNDLSVSPEEEEGYLDVPHEEDTVDISNDVNSSSEENSTLNESTDNENRETQAESIDGDSLNNKEGVNNSPAETEMMQPENTRQSDDQSMSQSNEPANEQSPEQPQAGELKNEPPADEMSQLQGNPSFEDPDRKSEMDTISGKGETSDPGKESEMEALTKPAENYASGGSSGAPAESPSQSNQEDNEYSY